MRYEGKMEPAAIEKILSWLAAAPTVYGAAGAAYSAVRGRNCRKSKIRCILVGILTLLGGVTTSTVTAPIILAYLPEPWHPASFFLAGLGGVATMEWTLDLGKRFVEAGVMRQASKDDSGPADGAGEMSFFVPPSWKHGPADLSVWPVKEPDEKP